MLLAELHTMHIVNCMYPPLPLHVVLPAGAVGGSAAQPPASPEQVEMDLLEVEVEERSRTCNKHAYVYIYIYIYVTCDRLNLCTISRSFKIILLQVPHWPHWLHRSRSQRPGPVLIMIEYD